MNACNDIILGVPFFQQTRMHLDYGANGCTVTFNNGGPPTQASKQVTLMRAPAITLLIYQHQEVGHFIFIDPNGKVVEWHTNNNSDLTSRSNYAIS